MQEDFALAEVGSVVYTKHGSKTHLGGNHWSYSSSIGEKNTWNGSDWVRWIYNSADKSVRVGNLTIGHNPNGALTITGDSGITVGRLAWYSQWYNGVEWNNITLDNYAWRGFSVNDTHAFAYQQFWGNTGELNITYIYSNSQEFKIIVDVTNDAAQSVPVRLIWGASQIKDAVGNYELIYDEIGGENITTGIDIDGTKFFWLDVRNYDPNIAINTVLDKPNRRAAVVFGNQSSILPAGYTYTLDPTFSDDIQADGDDDYWRNPYGTPSHVTNSDDIYFANASYSPGKRRGQVRFSLPIAQGVTIESAYFTGYETYDQSNQYDHILLRIDETNVGSLESDGSVPTLDRSIVAQWESDGSGNEWSPLIDVTDILQAQVDLVGWDEDYYIGFGFESVQTSGSLESFEDYQDANSNHANISIEWSTGAGDNYSVTVSEFLDIYDTASMVWGGVVTVGEVLDIYNSIMATTGGLSTVIIMEILPIDESTSTAVSLVEVILEILPFVDSVRAEINAIDAVIIYLVLPISISEVIEGGLEGLNIFYDLFMSANMWGYLGPMALVIIGYFLVRKDAVLGVLWFIVECLFVYHYTTLLAAHPAYWWQIFILLFGGLLTVVFPLWDR